MSWLLWRIRSDVQRPLTGVHFTAATRQKGDDEIMPEPQMYVIYAGDRSRCSDEIVWWGPDQRGYTTVLDRAGRYTREEAERLQCGETIPVPVEMAEAAAVSVVPKEQPIVRYVNDRIAGLRQDAD